MKDIKIKINSNTSMVYPENDILGINYENLQGNLIFYFDNDFINGVAWLEISMPSGEKGYLAMEQVDNTYVLPIKSSLLKEVGVINMQLRITQEEIPTGVPIFKSNMFYLKIKEAINSFEEIPEEYSTWIDIANEKIIEIDKAISKVETLNIESKRVEDGVEITFIDKQGATIIQKVKDGEKGDKGEAGEYAAGDNVTIKNNTISVNLSDITNELSTISHSLHNYSLKDNAGASLNLTYEIDTHTLEISLLNEKSIALSTKSISLPLESMVVNGRYDSDTKKIIMTLQNGNEVEVSIGDLISGLVGQDDFNNLVENIGDEFEKKFDTPYYFEYEVTSTDYETTDETILSMFNEIREDLENGYKPTVIVRKGATGVNTLQTYHFVVPQFGSFDTSYIMLKSSPVKKIDGTFDVIALNCERNAETGLITRVYENKEDSEIKIINDLFVITDTTTSEEKVKIMQKVYDLFENGILARLNYVKNNLVFTLFDVDKYSSHIDFYVKNGGNGSTRYGISYYSFDRYKIKCNYENNEITSVDIEELSDMFQLANDAEILGINNTTPFTPEYDYQPATKKYVDNQIVSSQYELGGIYYASVNADTNSWCTKELLQPILQEAYDKGYDDVMIKTANGGRFITCNGGSLQDLSQGILTTLQFVNLQYLTGSTVYTNRIFIGYCFANNITLDDNGNVAISGTVGTKNTYADLMPINGLTKYDGYDATATQVLKNVNGTFTWVTE